MFFNEKTLAKAVKHAVSLIEKKQNIMLQERIVPPLLSKDTGLREDWNIRVLVSGDEHGKGKAGDMVVRIGPFGNAINIRKGASYINLEEVARRLGWDERTLNKLKEDVASVSERAYEAIHRAMIQDGLLGPYDTSADFMGVDIIVRQEGNDLVPIVMEDNGSGSGGGFNIDKIVESTDPGRMGRWAEGWIETMVRRGREYQKRMGDAPGTSSDLAMTGMTRRRVLSAAVSLAAASVLPLSSGPAAAQGILTVLPGHELKESNVIFVEHAGEAFRWKLVDFIKDLKGRNISVQEAAESYRSNFEREIRDSLLDFEKEVRDLKKIIGEFESVHHRLIDGIGLGLTPDELLAASAFWQKRDEFKEYLKKIGVDDPDQVIKYVVGPGFWLVKSEPQFKYLDIVPLQIDDAKTSFSAIYKEKSTTYQTLLAFKTSQAEKDQPVLNQIDHTKIEPFLKRIQDNSGNPDGLKKIGIPFSNESALIDAAKRYLQAHIAYIENQRFGDTAVKEEINYRSGNLLAILDKRTIEEVIKELPESKGVLIANTKDIDLAMQAAAAKQVTRLYYIGSGQDHVTPAFMVNGAFGNVREAHMIDPVNSASYVQPPYDEVDRYTRVKTVTTKNGAPVDIYFENRNVSAFKPPQTIEPVGYIIKLVGDSSSATAYASFYATMIEKMKVGDYLFINESFLRKDILDDRRSGLTRVPVQEFGLKEEVVKSRDWTTAVSFSADRLLEMVGGFPRIDENLPFVENGWVVFRKVGRHDDNFINVKKQEDLLAESGALTITGPQGTNSFALAIRAMSGKNDMLIPSEDPVAVYTAAFR